MLDTSIFRNNFFNQDIPFLQRKQSAFDIQDLPGLWRIHWQVGETTVLSTFYTRIDQACLLWGLITVGIFAIAQFTLIDWEIQAVLATALTLAGTLGMVWLAKYCAGIEALNQVITGWVVLMLSGLAITDLSIILEWGQVLALLCPLWLGINAFGYVYTGLKMRSRAFFIVSLLHCIGILILPYIGMWQYLTTGVVIGFSSILLAELQWDSSGVCNGHIMTELE